ncbi:DEAD/DEAH box helicase family protein, partial [Zoogloea sp.]|uniref:DEAD/DEAH box helicase family protein n=1 Tax=Zoogloea sp. TaxID=49181 RepID=UPI001ACF8C6D
MTRFSSAQVLAQLKDFQRRTVDHVFHRMYLDAAPTRRFLVADEVGLGKTMVAKGIIARTIEHLQDSVERIDIVYVCSNSAIAQQNVARLKVDGGSEFALASRLTLLPTEVHNLRKNRVNFVSFTPGTTFDLKSRAGLMRERVVLFRMLRGERWLDAGGLLNVLQATAGRERWQECACKGELPLDADLTEAFCVSLQTDEAFRKKLIDLC